MLCFTLKCIFSDIFWDEMAALPTFENRSGLREGFLNCGCETGKIQSRALLCASGYLPEDFPFTRATKTGIMLKTYSQREKTKYLPSKQTSLETGEV